MSKRKNKHFVVSRFTRSDLSDLYHSQEFPNSPIADPNLHPMILSGSTSFVIRHEGEVLTAGGVVPLWRGCGEAWLAVREEMTKHPFALTKICKKLLNELKGGFHRVQMTAVEDEPGHIRWARLLGFQEEGRMIQYGPDGKTHIRLAKTWPLEHLDTSH